MRMTTITDKWIFNQWHDPEVDFDRKKENICQIFFDSSSPLISESTDFDFYDHNTRSKAKIVHCRCILSAIRSVCFHMNWT